jgi:hypothetical protein
MTDSQIVQSCGHIHEPIGTSWPRIAQSLFHPSRPLDPAHGMFDSDTNPRQGPIVPTLGGSQPVAAKLFFGCWVCLT